jgi:hypothetical protein
MELDRALGFARGLLFGEEAEFLLAPYLNPRAYWRVIQQLKKEGFICMPNAVRYANGLVEFMFNSDRSLSLVIIRRIVPVTCVLISSARLAEPLMWQKIWEDEHPARHHHSYH